MHINLHKTFSTPHGGGGPRRRTGGVLGASSPRFAPLPLFIEDENGFSPDRGF
jgi:glycine cleavage system protein P-like pyridoxal-binding family